MLNTGESYLRVKRVKHSMKCIVLSRSGLLIYVAFVNQFELQTE